jgi:hypothetical protein
MDPEVLDGAKDVVELRKIDGFHHITFGMELVGTDDVFVGAGGGQDDHGDAEEGGGGLNFAQDFAAVHFGEVQVQEHQVGAGGVIVRRTMEEEVEGFGAVVNNAQAVLDAGVFEDFLGEADIAGVIFDEEYFDGGGKHESRSFR